MVSFIIIGRNESENLQKCFKSIWKIISRNNLQGYEIVYIDSDSDDNSIDIAKENHIHKIVKLEQYYNAAIARNTGFEYSNNDILIFIDGDMNLIELDINEVKEKLDNNTIIKGIIIENIYNEGDLKKTYERTYPKNLCGGTFIITHGAYESVGRMDNKMKKGQDYDFFVRANKLGLKMKKLSSFKCEHNTEDYRSVNRVKYRTINSALFRGYFFRKNILKSLAYKIILYEFYPIIFSGLTILIFALSKIGFLAPISFLILLGGSLYKTRRTLKIRNYMHEILRQIMFSVSFLFFYPRNKKVYQKVVK